MVMLSTIYLFFFFFFFFFDRNKYFNTTHLWTIARAVNRTSRVKRYHELGFERLILRKWMQCLCHYYKLQNNRLPLYLYPVTPQPATNIQIHFASSTPPLETRAVAFIYLFSNVICDCNNFAVN